MRPYQTPRRKPHRTTTAASTRTSPAVQEVDILGKTRRYKEKPRGEKDFSYCLQKLDLFTCSIIHKHQHTTASALGSDLILMGDLLFPKEKERRNGFGRVGTEGMGLEEGLGG